MDWMAKPKSTAGAMWINKWFRIHIFVFWLHFMPGAFISIWHIYFRTVHMKGFNFVKAVGKNIKLHFQNVSCFTNVNPISILFSWNITHFQSVRVFTVLKYILIFISHHIIYNCTQHSKRFHQSCFFERREIEQSTQSNWQNPSYCNIWHRWTFSIGK